MAASSIRLLIAAAPLPESHAWRYWIPIRTLPAQALLGALPGRPVDRQQVGGGDVHVLAEYVDLVRPVAEDPVEDLPAHRHQVGMGDPGAVEPGLGLPVLVLPHLRERPLVDLRVAAARDERRHPADRERPAPVAGPHQQVAVGLHHRRVHRDRVAVREGERRTGVAEVLDDAEQVVPAPGVQPGHVVAQLVEDLVHLERGGDRLDQHRRPDRAVRDLQGGLGVGEDVVPQPRLEVRLHLRQVEVGAGSASQQLGRVVEEVEAEVDQAAGDRGPVDHEVGLVEVPAARAGHDHRDPVGVGDRRTPSPRAR